MGNLEFAVDELHQSIRDVSTLVPSRDEAGRVGDTRVGDVLTRLNEIERPLREARGAAERVRVIVRDLKAFSRSEEEAGGPVDVHRVIDAAIRMTHNEIRHRARLVRLYGNVPPVEANEAKLSQVFVNLLVNAAHAMPEGVVDRNEIRVETSLRGDDRVAVEVRDTGVGIPAHELPRSFDPFFTTKPVGVGTGLGLAICHRIVTTFGGEMEAESRPGEGTAIRTVLRVANGEVSEPQGRASPVSRRCGRILVVDDEAVLVVAVQRMLSSAHEVVGLTNAREALECILKGERFDVVLCDLMMPDVTGMDLHVALSRDAPDQAERMVFMTGGAFTTRARDLIESAHIPCIEKPFDSECLLRFVDSLLEEYP